MAQQKMLILRGNPAGAGSYPDEQGKTVAWPIGALHVQAASTYAQRLGLEAVVLPVSGKPQNQHSPQAKAALKAFLEDEAVVGFYGFSGGGYNLKHILDYLAWHEPQSIRRIKWVVVLGAPNPQGKSAYQPSSYNATARKRAKDKEWKDADWDVVYRTNPHTWQMPKGLPKDTETHMFGPDVLLAGWPEGIGTSKGER
jgi:hypothetical protein